MAIVVFGDQFVGGGGDGAESAGSEAANTIPAAAPFVESPQTPDGITGVSRGSN
jgi:hypothetical protein